MPKRCCHSITIGEVAQTDLTGKFFISFSKHDIIKLVTCFVLCVRICERTEGLVGRGSVFLTRSGVAHQISHIRRRVILLSGVTTVVATAILLLVTEVAADLTPEGMRGERIYLLALGGFLLVGVILALHLYLRPISDLGYALEIGSTPTAELGLQARRIAFNAPVHFFVFPTIGVFVIAVLSSILRSVVWPEHTFAATFGSALLSTAIAACSSLVISLVSRRLMRPLLLYTAAQRNTGGYRLNLRTRLFFAILPFAVLSVLFTGLPGYNQVVRTYRERVIDKSLLHLSNAVGAISADLPEGQILRRMIESLGEHEYEFVFLLDSDGQVLDQQQPSSTEWAFDSSVWLKERPNRLRRAEESFVLSPLPFQHERWVGIGFTIHPLRSEDVIRTIISLCVSGGFLLALAALVSHHLAADLVVDLTDVTTRLLDIAHEERVDLSSPVPVLSLDEVGDLVLAYNALQQRVRAQQEQIEYKQRQLIALQSLSYKIGTVMDVDHLLREVVRDVERAFGYHNVSVLLVDDQGENLYFAVDGYPDDTWRDRKFKIGQDGVVGRVAATGDPLLINDVSTCDFYIADQTNTRSELAVPLSVADKVIGVFNVSSERIGAFNDSDLRITTALANQVAIAIENARLFNEVVSNTQELERRAQDLMSLHDVSIALGASLRIEEVLNTATEQLVSMFEIEHSTVILFGAEDEYGEVAAEYPAMGIAGDRVLTNRLPAARRILTSPSPLHIIDAQHSELLRPLRKDLKTLNIESMLLVPLLTKGNVVGIISLDSIAHRHSFTEEQIGICQTIAAQVAVSVENVRLFENMRLQADLLARMARDVTAERSQLDAILRNLTDGLLVTDLTGRVILFNPAFRSLFDLPEGGLRGESITYVVSQVPLQQLVLQTGGDGIVRSQEITLPDGRCLHATAAGVREGDQLSGVVVVLRDITREKQLDQMKSDFVSTVSHELRTPLTPVLGFAKLIRKSFHRHILPLVPTDNQEGSRASQRIEQNLEIIVSEVERLSDLVDDVLFLADLDAGRIGWQMEWLNLDEILENAVHAYRTDAESKNLIVRTEWPADLPKLCGDGERLQRAVGNLISNAVKFTDVGEILVRAQVIHWEDDRWAPSPFVKVPEQLPQGDYALIAVRDTGPGISSETRQALFERFGQGVGDMLTQKPSGTGLGLALSKEIVSYHGGHIWAESKPGPGSTFAFVVPLLCERQKD